MNLAGVDLNLLVTLNALLEEKHVTRAGQVVGMSQPAVSSALGRLRGLFGDELLERDGRHMRLTERALQLRDPLKAVLADIDNILERPTIFDPATTPFTVSIFASDMVSFAILPALRKIFKEQAPLASIIVKWQDREKTLDMLEAEEADIAIGHYEDMPEQFMRRLIFEEEPVVLARKGHPFFDSDMSVETLVGFPRIQTSLEGQLFTWIEQAIARLGIAAHNDIVVAHPLAAPMIAWQSDLLTITGRRFAEHMSGSIDVDFRPLPFDIEDLDFEMVWHKQSERNPGHVWTRERLMEIATDL